jgi:hypothetical protein
MRHDDDGRARPWLGSISVAAQRSPWLWKEESMLTMQGSNAECG